jgi:aminotransferase
MSSWKETLIAERARNIKSPKFGVIAEIRKLIDGTKDAIILGYGEPEFNTPKHICEAAKKAIDEGFTHYVLPPEGLTELREAIAKKISAKNGFNVNPSTEVLVTEGVQGAISVATLTFVKPGDEVIVAEPYYYSHPLSVIFAGGVPVYTELREDRDFRLDPDDIKKKITRRTKALILLDPNNPTGSVLTKEDLKAISEIVKNHNLLVITDEIYENLVYDDAKHYSIASFPGMKEHTISIFGFSKSYAMTGWRVGYIVADKSFMRYMKEVHAQLTICTNAIAQKAALAALTDSQDCVEEMRQKYETRRNIFVDGLNRLGLTCKSPKGAFYVYAKVSKFNLTSTEFAKRLTKEAKVLGYPGTAYTLGKSGEKYIRFSLTVSEEKLKTALERIRKVILPSPHE